MRCEYNLWQNMAGNKNKNNEKITLGGELPVKQYMSLKLSQIAFNSNNMLFFRKNNKKQRNILKSEYINHNVCGAVKATYKDKQSGPALINCAMTCLFSESGPPLQGLGNARSSSVSILHLETAEGPRYKSPRLSGRLLLTAVTTELKVPEGPEWTDVSFVLESQINPLRQRLVKSGLWDK